MHKTHALFPFSLTICYGVVGVLVVAYIGLIAVVMSSVVLTVEFTVDKNDVAAVALLEGQYLANVAHITRANVARSATQNRLSKRL